jgi:hypothetical protein
MTKLTIALLLGAALCSAGPITYNVNQTVGSGGVTGTIQTDGATGALGNADVIGWDLFLNDGSGIFELTTANSTFFTGGDLSATASDLLFNFTNSDSGFFLFEASSAPAQFWCPEAAASICMVNSLFSGSGESLDLDDTNPNTEQFTTYTGTNVVVASISDPVGANDPSVDPIGTPEPSTFSFLGLGIAALGFWKYRAGRVNV